MQQVPGLNSIVTAAPAIIQERGSGDSALEFVKDSIYRQAFQAQEILTRCGFWQAFGEKAVFSCIFGSAAYRYSDNDIDIFTLLRSPLTEKENTQAVNAYLELHRELRLNPDRKFPGEYITLTQVRRSLIGGGFAIQHGELQIPEIPNGSAWNSFNDFRHHLTALGGPSVCLFGSSTAWAIMRKRALITITTLCLIKSKSNYFTLESLTNSIIGSGKSYLGFANDQGVRQYLAEMLPSIILHGQQKNWWQREKSNACFTIKDDIALRCLRDQIARQETFVHSS